MTQPELDGCHAEQLATLLASCDDTVHVWKPDDLAAILRHQLSLRPETDFDTYVFQGTPRRQVDTARSAGFDTYLALFQAKQPPIDVLRRVKDCAKSAVRDPNAPLPDDVATVIYFVAIAVALAAHGQRITRLADDGLRWGFQWSLKQAWLADSLRPLLARGLAALGGDAAEGRRPKGEQRL